MGRDRLRRLIHRQVKRLILEIIDSHFRMPIDTVGLRHAESEGNIANHRSKREGDHSDWTDEFAKRHNRLWRLTDNGLGQTPFARAWLEREFPGGFDAYYTSEFLRAGETGLNATAGFENVVWQFLFNIRERDWGKMNGLSWDVLRDKFADELARRETDRLLWGPPDGEAMASVAVRGELVLEMLKRRHSQDKVLLVLHGEMMWMLRFLIENMTIEQYTELDASTHEFDRIHNCQVIHWTRRDPKTGIVYPEVRWMRSICTTDESRSYNEWQPVQRPRFTNKDMQAMLERYPRVIAE